MQRLLLLGLGLMLLVGILVVMLVALVTAIAQADCGNGTPTTTVTAPGPSVQTMGEDTKYLESEGIPAVDAAGIVGNLMQESTLNPTEPGYGLAQWKPDWWASASAWISTHGQNPNTAGGQLMYIAANVTQGLDAGRFSDYAGLRTDLARATSAQEAAIVWMNDYEQCSGAGPAGSLSFTPYSLCEPERRETYAIQALQAAGGAQGGGGGALLTSLTTNEACNAVFPLTGSIKGYTNPFEKATGIVWERTDEGVDAAMAPGSPLLAFAPSKVIEIVPFYLGQPAIVFEITSGPLAGKWWYWSEQIQPTVSPGQTVSAGQVVATYAPSGTGIEIGWWEVNGGYPLGHPGYTDGLATNAGAAFRYLLQALGANPGSGVGLSSGTTIGNGYYPTGNPGPGP
ncbi:MAG TPA: phage tail tip lysozyme [Chloroflexota bacterium]